MLRSDFIDSMFAFFKCKDEELKRAYDLAFTVKEPIDWDKLYRIVLNEAESRYLPAPKWFKDFFPRCIKQENCDYTTQNGIKVKLTLSDGYEYEFETYQLNRTLPEMKQAARKKYGSKFKSMAYFWETENEQGYQCGWTTI